jgi:ABC-2 type transport system ATP-binding protein
MLKISGLSKNFGSLEVLKDLNLEIREGSIFGLVGINGAGKSTLLRLIAGVYQPDAGVIAFNGKNTYTDASVRNEIAFVSDELYYPLGATIASQKILYESMYHFSEEKYRKYLKMFDLDEKRTIANLSKGNRRRVALLFALSTSPKLLLLDEAYDGLEPLVRLKFRKALADLIETENISVIISSHNLRELEDICDSFGILQDGKIVSYGDLLESEQSVNKYQLAFEEEKKKEDFASFDLLHYEQEGRVIQAVIRGERTEVQKQLEAMHPVFIDVLSVSFEELFMYEVESRGKEDE